MNRAAEWRQSMRRQAGNARGFTLIEMIVVVSLIVIFLSIGIPSMREAMYADPLKSAARKLIGIVNEARQRAQEERQPYIVFIDRAERKIWFEKEEATGNDDTEVEKEEELSLPADIEIGEIISEDSSASDSSVLPVWISGKGYVNRTRLQLVNDDGDTLFLDFQPFIAETGVADNADDSFVR